METFASGNLSKTIIESIVANGLPPEEVVRRLDSVGIEWYVTEHGDLMLRYWQVGAEDFVPKERVATIRENHNPPSDADALEWVSSHLGELKREYGNRWIAVIGNRVAASAENLPDLMQEIEESETGAHPFVTFIPAQPIVWATAYGNQNI